jgi:hypothetical protein
MNTRQHVELLPVCTLAAIFGGFVAYLFFAPDVLPSIIAGCIAVLGALVVVSLEEPPFEQVPIELEEDSFARLIHRG